jgi:DNA-binding transcriptional LysR family regulator
MIRELPDLRQVRAFVALAETRNFTRASEQLFLTQSAVSHSIRSLEQQLEVKLVERSGKRISLTQDGVVFLRRCHAIIHELEMASQEIEALKRWGQGRIRLGATHTLCQYLLPTVLREFRDCFPRCEIHIESGDTSALISQLEKAQLDLVLGMGSRTPGWAQFQPLFQDELVFVVSAQHPWAQKKEIPLKEVAAESFLVYAKNSETHRLIRSHFESLGVKLRVTLNLGSMAAIKEMARIGIGVGIVSPWVAREELNRGVLVQVPIRKEPLSREWGAIIHDGKSLSLIEDTFLSLCGLTARTLTKVETPSPVESPQESEEGSYKSLLV